MKEHSKDDLIPLEYHHKEDLDSDEHSNKGYHHSEDVEPKEHHHHKDHHHESEFDS